MHGSTEYLSGISLPSLDSVCLHNHVSGQRTSPQEEATPTPSQTRSPAADPTAVRGPCWKLVRHDGERRLVKCSCASHGSSFCITDDFDLRAPTPTSLMQQYRCSP